MEYRNDWIEAFQSNVIDVCSIKFTFESTNYLSKEYALSVIIVIKY